MGVETRLPQEPSPEALSRAWTAVSKACGVGYEEFSHRVAKHFRLGVADVSTWDPQAISLIPERVARTYGILPLSLEEDRVVVATPDPSNASARGEIVAHAGRTPVFLVASPWEIEGALDRAYAPVQSVRSNLSTLVAAAASEELSIVSGQISDELVPLEVESPPVVKLADVILRVAVRYRATEIHLVPGRKTGYVRYRIDGVLQDYVELPLRAQERVLARFKNMALRASTSDGGPRNLFPLQGRDGRDLEAHVRTTATPDGEHATIRITDPNHLPTLQELGFHGALGDRLRPLLEVRDGLVLVTGPARSGKTSLVYAALSDAKGMNVVSLENPVERVLPGVTQIEYDASTGRSYAEVLQALLGETPDLLHAGEIRDLDTARTVLRAAVTGRRVLATLHTSDAVSAVRRLMEMGLDPGRLLESLRGVVSLRLIRRLCPECARPVREPGDLASRELQLSRKAGRLPALRVAGCPECGGTGYRGELPLVEVLATDASMESALHPQITEAELERWARNRGMRTLADVARDRIAAGETSYQEAERVLGVVPDAGSGVGPVGPVLIVDDEPGDRLLIRGVLEDMGLEVVESEGGPSALALLGSGEHDVSLMVLDLLMPEMHGIEVLKRVRRSLDTQALPIVVLTASPDPRDEIEVLDAGADDFLLKPLVADRLRARISAVLRRSGIEIPGVP